MLIISLINRLCDYLFTPKPYVSELEKFIVSKQPTNTAELDHWMQVWDHNQRLRSKSFSEGRYHPYGFWD